MDSTKRACLLVACIIINTWGENYSKVSSKVKIYHITKESKMTWKKILPVNVIGKTWDAQYIAEIITWVFSPQTSTEKATYLIDPSWDVVFHIRDISDKYHLFRKQSWKYFSKELFISLNIGRKYLFYYSCSKFGIHLS